MDEPSNSREKTVSTPAVPAAASELNNLLQIVSGTVGLLENIWEGTPAAEKYFDMLRVSVDRAAKITSELVRHVGGTDQKILLHPALATSGRPLAGRERAPAKTRCILVIDDEPMALVLSKHVLTQAGFAVVTAQSGFEALDTFSKIPGRFSAVLLDLTMPLMDGEETFNRLRAMDPKVTVLLNTGFIEKHQLDRMMAAGLAGFLRRPYRPTEVVEQLESVLANTRSEVAGTVPAAPTELVLVPNL